MRSQEKENFIKDDMNDGGEHYRQGIFEMAFEWVVEKAADAVCWVKDTFFWWW